MSGTSTPAISLVPLRRADVALIIECRLRDADGVAPDPRLAAYLEGRHHPHQALPPRVGYLAHAGDEVAGYIAGHLTTRYGYQAEVQYLFVTAAHRRRGVATALLGCLLKWFLEQGAATACVCVDADSPPAIPFYRALGAEPFKKYWYGWTDVNRTLAAAATSSTPRTD